MTSDKLILIVEDEPKIAQVLVEFLHLEGFKTCVEGDGLKVVDFVKSKQPSLIILDVMLPNKDGLTICKEIRQFSNVPIIMATARVDEIDRLLGLGIGADDYVCKPFSPREVVARVQTVLRRTESVKESVVETLCYKMIEMDLDRYTCHVSEEAIQLTPVEFRLLAFLLKKPGVVYSRDNLMRVCYEDERIVSVRTIDSHMKNLRSKLSACIKGVSILHSVYGVGYKID